MASMIGEDGRTKTALVSNGKLSMGSAHWAASEPPVHFMESLSIIETKTAN